jgi:hypothetical protein
MRRRGFGEKDEEEDGGGDAHSHSGKKTTRVDVESIQQRTLARLMGAASHEQLDMMEVEESGTCLLCGEYGDSLVACSHCDKRACELCLRECSACQDFFCSVCSRIDYGQRFERAFCFDCSDQAVRAAMHNNHNNNTGGQSLGNNFAGRVLLRQI